MATATKGKVKVQPLGDRVVIRPLEEGEIVAVGPGRYERGALVPMELKVGNKVLYGKYSGTEVTIEDEQLLIIKESDVLAVIG
jgi:chaperonin GroES